jgi:hypothetical protein
MIAEVGSDQRATRNEKVSTKRLARPDRVTCDGPEKWVVAQPLFAETAGC